MTAKATDDDHAIENANVITRSHFAIDTAIAIITKLPV
jgi:hypothetical protein